MDEQNNIHQDAPQAEEQNQPVVAAPQTGPYLMRTSELLKKSWQTYTANFNSLAPIVLIAGIGLYLGLIALIVTGHRDLGYTVGSTGNQAIGGSYAILSLITTIIYIAGMIWAVPTLINRINKLNQPMSVGQAFKEGKPYIWQIIITGIFVGGLTLIGLILLIIPGIIVGVWLAFTQYVVVLENKKGGDALKSSKEYVKDFWWAVAGRLFVIGLVVGLVSSIIGGIATLIINRDIGGFIQSLASLLLIPFAMIYQYNLFTNLKAVKSQNIQD